MSILYVLYSIVISPLIIVFDCIFTLVLNKILYVGWSIVILSLTINILVLPLYNRADVLQAREAEKKRSINKWETHIKKSFKGDERFMMLQTYYRQNNYKPYYALRGILPLLLEIPFFIAAYQYLSSLSLLNGYSFGPIKDLSVPDKMLVISGISINVLPVIMTFINIISSLIYNRTSSIRDKIQLYIIAFIFLILLYNSPSGLVLYWICNNMFSLCKNFVYRFVIKDRFVNRKNEKTDKEKSNSLLRIFVGASFLMSLLVGVFIPGDLIGYSIDEFISPIYKINPALYIINSFLIAFGFFFVWIGIYYYLMGLKGRTIISCGLTAACAIGFLDYLIIPFESSMTQFITLTQPLTTVTPFLLFQSFAIIIASFALFMFVIKYKYKELGYILIFILIPFLFINIFNSISIYNKADTKLEFMKKYDDFPEIRFSKNGKNVVVIMMDKMISYYIPFILNEKPELKDSWDGFVYYPNCISYGASTNVGSPGLYGGYEYTPEEMNERDGELLKNKHNEALSVMPVLFGENGYDVTVGDPTFANYEWIPNLSIYDKYPYIYKYYTGAKLNPDNLYYVYDDVLKRNLVLYGVFRATPIFLQSTVYDNGEYNSSNVSLINGVGLNNVYSLSTTIGINEPFLDSYSVLYNLSNISRIDDKDVNHFNMFSNNTTHEACLFKEPEYELDFIVDNKSYDKEHRFRQSDDGRIIDLYGPEFDNNVEKNSYDEERVMFYHVDMASMLRLGEWFDYLRENGVYDNTRIIIVSDHSAILNLDNNLVSYLTYTSGETKYCDLLSAQSTMLVKDFNATGFNIDDSFMTNADVPALACDGIIDNPTNPFTGNPINCQKKEGDINIIYTNDWNTDLKGYTFNKSEWYSVHDNIFDPNNWTYIGTR